MPLRYTLRALFLVGLGAVPSNALAGGGNASELLLGQAPLIFSQGHLNAALRDGTIATTDEIYLWVPAVDVNGDVDLGVTGQFFLIWDSGSTGGSPNNVALGGNDDEDNEMRGLHFDPADGGSFLISYDDTTTTGFTAETAIPDGNLIRVSPAGPFSNGQMQDFLLATELQEGVNGVSGDFSDGDLYGFGVAPDGTFYWASGSASLETTTGGTINKASNEFVHTEGFASPVGSPRNIGDTLFYGSNVSPPGFVFPTFINGQGRAVEVLADGGVLIGVSDTYNYPNDADTGIDILLDRWDVGLIDPVTFDITLVYPGELFFQTIDTTSAEMLDLDVLDTQEELQAFRAMIGADSDPGMALQAFIIEAGGCNTADLAEPFGSLDFSDVVAFLTAFGSMDAAADLAPPIGVFDFSDVVAFLGAFGVGCP